MRGKQVLLHLSRNTDSACIKVVTIGNDVAFSLETTDEAIAAARHANALEHLQRLFDLTAGPPITLSHRDMVALAGEVYHAYVYVHEDNPGEPGRWAWHKGLTRAVLEGRIKDAPPATFKVDDYDAASGLFETGNLTQSIDALPAGQHDGLEARFGLLADWVLIRHIIHLAPDDRKRFLRLVGVASLDASWQLRRNAEGDYSPDPKAQRFPPIDSVTSVKPKLTITGLLDHWWQEARATGRSQKTYETYRGAVDRLVKHLGHDDARRVTESDMLAFKDARLKVVTAKSLKDGDLPGIRSVFGWAVDNRKLTKNPADAVKVKSEKKKRTRSKGFTDDEAKAIFKACLGYVRKPKEDSKTAAAKRWAPLIAAYTGCRIAEALQLRKEDIRNESGHYIFDLNPLAGSIKSGSYRLVPVHQHLIELGLLSFIDGSDHGPLFAKGSYKRVTDLVRTVATDERIQPNHAWRHRLKTISRNLGLDHRVVDCIQGHAARTSGEDYGDVTVTAMARVISAIPRIMVDTGKSLQAAQLETAG
ncbi:tyrosine-type recombinase/integrase [Bradyrhizobium roseum]|uniref:tyrosine-type recombinase/integrase n=1 Tax=Bradyrhizobium roseum TaxID=3056648 RepID=UPI002616F789|nr:tyrosine-type recombinase/integrase [Bradyrhizobium roseus]WKA29344.1 tyrosine-type recombinase/integrase [Bradyrhizobium roseus]